MQSIIPVSDPRHDNGLYAVRQLICPAGWCRESLSKPSREHNSSLRGAIELPHPGDNMFWEAYLEYADQCLNHWLICNYANTKAGRNLSAGFSPFEVKFRKILDEVDRLERNVEKDIAVLRLEGNLHRSTSSRQAITVGSGDMTARVQEWRVVTTCGLHGGSAKATGITRYWNVRMVRFYSVTTPTRSLCVSLQFFLWVGQSLTWHSLEQ